MAEAYEAKGRTLLDRGSYRGAELMLARAAYLAAGRPEARRVDALRAIAAALRDEQAGLDPRWGLQRALALDPQSAQARRHIARVRRSGRTQTLLVAGSAATVAALVLLALFRRKGRQAT